MSFLRVQDISIRLGIFHLNNVSLELEKDEYVAVIGPTGAGKTILLECIIGFYRPDSGNIFLEGRNITDERPENRRIGIVYQDYALLPNLTVFDNIAYGLKKYIKDRDLVRERVEAMAESLHISHIMGRHPETLSGGEQQRVALARSLVVEPKLLLMDEPFSALDAMTREKLQAQLLKDRLKTPLPYVLVTHSIEEAAYLGRTILLLAGSPATIKARYDNPGFGDPELRETDQYFSLVRKIRQGMGKYF